MTAKAMKKSAIAGVNDVSRSTRTSSPGCSSTMGAARLTTMIVSAMAYTASEKKQIRSNSSPPSGERGNRRGPNGSSSSAAGSERVVPPLTPDPSRSRPSRVGPGAAGHRSEVHQRVEPDRDPGVVGDGPHGEHHTRHE